eukprot:TRINITY_DN78604_c0_g1_i1.p1 TRINITY_DN78604_c0_g1~~TRINITY_DN78604_c0_g1_i1.p1  ORF type:complete len:175 (-),score=14.26 TRINITY_DN78604_c0_g1_i1:604-1128(-)
MAFPPVSTRKFTMPEEANVGPTMSWPTSAKDLFEKNQLSRRSIDWKIKSIHYNRLRPIRVAPGDGDMSWKSHATNFSRGGIVDRSGKSWIRDPRTGVWFKQKADQLLSGMKPTFGTPVCYELPDYDTRPDPRRHPQTLSQVSTAPVGTFRSEARNRFVSRADVIPHVTVTLPSP